MDLVIVETDCMIDLLKGEKAWNYTTLGLEGVSKQKFVTSLKMVLDKNLEDMKVKFLCSVYKIF